MDFFNELLTFWFRWWRLGWATATVLLAGWLLHALWLGRPPNGSPVANRAGAYAKPDSATEENRGTVAREEMNPVPTMQKDSGRAALEIAGLHRQIVDLSNHITQLSQSVAQQQAALLETNRLKFFQLTALPDGAPGTNAPLSPALQRALFLAMARELGWSPPGSRTEPSPTGGGPFSQHDLQPATTTSIAGVDFVDLRCGSNGVANPPQTDTQPGDSSDQLLLATRSASSVPGFISGTNAVVAFDSSIVPSGTAVRFWTGGGGQSYQLIGSSVLGQNPMVVTIPFSTAGGATLTVTTGNSASGSNILGQFPPAPGGP